MVRHGEIKVVLLDMMMPRMDGKATFLALREIRTDVVAILITGHALNEEAQAILDMGVKFFLRKPCGLDVLSDTIARAIRGESA
jgi:DNA-binding NtrC family response regulator